MICMICTCFASWILYDKALMTNISTSAKKDLVDLDHHLSEVWNFGIPSIFASKKLKKSFLPSSFNAKASTNPSSDVADTRRERSLWHGQTIDTRTIA